MSCRLKVSAFFLGPGWSLIHGKFNVTRWVHFNAISNSPRAKQLNDPCPYHDPFDLLDDTSADWSYHPIYKTSRFSSLVLLPSTNNPHWKYSFKYIWFQETRLTKWFSFKRERKTSLVHVPKNISGCAHARFFDAFGLSMASNDTLLSLSRMGMRLYLKTGFYSSNKSQAYTHTACG